MNSSITSTTSTAWSARKVRRPAERWRRHEQGAGATRSGDATGRDCRLAPTLCCRDLAIRFGGAGMTAMLKLDVDGRAVEVPQGATVMDAATRLGIFVPHFCYHKKLSIAANCRMCLVQVEKEPKPMPALPTPAA